MDLESKLFKEYKKFIIKNSSYALEDYIYNDTPQKLTDFPTILFLENDNYKNNSSTERSEHTDSHQFKIEIYSKNKVVEGQTIARKIITNELKYLTFDFLNIFGLNRTACTKGEYLDLNVDRTIIMAECSTNSWDGKIR